MQDVQSQPPSIPIPINRVGIRNVKMPLLVRKRDHSSSMPLLHTSASIDISVDLPANFKGTHMSRFVEILQEWMDESDALDYLAIREILLKTRDRLNAKMAHITFKFPFFIEKEAPVSKRRATISYQCAITGNLTDESDKPIFFIDLIVPVMTVCPCSKAISNEGAHSQRAEVKIHVKMIGMLWIEDILDITDGIASAPVHTLLKREDEKYVTEHAFQNPAFVEDVVRNLAQKLQNHPHIASYDIEVDSAESIHAHNAFATIHGRNI